MKGDITKRKTPTDTLTEANGRKVGLRITDDHRVRVQSDQEQLLGLLRKRYRWRRTPGDS